MTLDITQFYQTFFDEADELLAQMEQLLLNLDIGAPDPEDLAAIFRAAHSIKGGAATFGFTALTETTHILESLLDRARNNELTLRKDMIDTFLETEGRAVGQLADYRASAEPDAAAGAAICAKLDQLDRRSKGSRGSRRCQAERAAPVAASAPAPAAPAAGDGRAPEHVVDQAVEAALYASRQTAAAAARAAHERNGCSAASEDHAARVSVRRTRNCSPKNSATSAADRRAR